MSHYELGVVIPVYNEQECVAKVLGEWEEVLQIYSNNFLIIVVNDGSTDGTQKILNEFQSHSRFKIIEQPNLGHGKAILHGYRYCIDHDIEWIFQVDSDDQFEPTDFSLLWETKPKGQIVLGQRVDRKDPLSRKLISHIVVGAIEALFGVSLLDPNVPFRLMHRNFLKHALKQIPPNIFAPNIFITIIGSQFGIRWIPIHHRARHTGTNSLLKWSLIKACLRSFSDLLAFKHKHREGGL